MVYVRGDRGKNKLKFMKYFVSSAESENTLFLFTGFFVTQHLDLLKVRRSWSE